MHNFVYYTESLLPLARDPEVDGGYFICISIVRSTKMQHIPKQVIFFGPIPQDPRAPSL